MVEKYTVSDAAKMLNVNEETIRRWIREGKLSAKRAVGRGGNTIYLEDVISFANVPPRAYLLAMERWLADRNIPYEKIEDSESAPNNRANVIATVAARSGAALASTLATAPLVGPIALAAGIASSSLRTKRKQYQNYSIRLLDTDTTSSTAIPEASLYNTKTRIHDSSEAISIQGGNAAMEQSENEVCTETVVTRVKEPKNSVGILEEITHAKQMLDEGIITQDEFVEIKARLISRL